MIIEVPQPSEREMAERVGVSHVATHHHLLAIEKKGAIARHGKRARAVDVLLPGLLWPDEFVTRTGVRLERVWP